MQSPTPINDPDNEFRPQVIPWVPIEKWTKRTSRDRDPRTAVLDPIWRVANLYQIKDREGRFVPFQPKPEQQVILWDIYFRNVHNLIIPKARRLGCSTLLMLILFDRLLFIAGHKGVLVDKTLTDAKIKLSDMVRVAWERLQPIERAPFDFRINAEAATCRIRSSPDDGMSSLRVTVSGRGGEAHFLVVSEWGTIQFEDQLRSNEIKTGAMISAQFGIRVIETTWKGGKGGDVWGYVKLALSIPDEQKGKGDWFLRFFPWYLDADYELDGDPRRIDAKTHEYLDAMTAETGVTFSPKKRMWYWMESQTQGLMMKREFPTVLRECWTAPIEGSIYGTELDKARTDGRITDFPVDLSIPVDTFWDLGAPENTACWFVQHVNGARRIIDHELGPTPETIASKGYRYGTMYLPHDGSSLKDNRGVSYQTELQTRLRELHIDARVVVVPRTPNIWLGINELTTSFKTFHFHATNCKRGIECLEAYRRKPDPNLEKAFLDEVVHDYSSHTADSLRTMAEAKLAQFLPSNTPTAMTNAYFDPDTLNALTVAAVPRSAAQRLGLITQQDAHYSYARIFIPDPAGHIRQWEAPREGSRYLITMTGKALQVWRAAERTPENTTTRAAMVAAILPDTRTQQTMMAVWASELSLVYGNCLTVPDITSGPIWVAQLQALGTPCFARKTAPQDKRVGTARPVRKPGWEFDTKGDVRLQAFQTLQAALPDLDIWCPHTLAQLAMVTTGPGDTPVTLEGSGEDWATAAAMAATTLPLATPFQHGALPVIRRPAHLHGEDNLERYNDPAMTAMLG